MWKRSIFKILMTNTVKSHVYFAQFLLIFSPLKLRCVLYVSAKNKSFSIFKVEIIGDCCRTKVYKWKNKKCDWGSMREKGRQLQASVWTKVFINKQTETIQTEKSHIFCLFTSISKVTYLGKVVTFCHNCTVKLSYNWLCYVFFLCIKFVPGKRSVIRHRYWR